MNTDAMNVLHGALDGLALRQRTIADNVANIETPHFLAGRVNFESSLRTAIETGQSPTADPVISRSLEPTRLNGNNVDLDQETLNMTETGLRYQLMVQAMSGKFSLLRTAIGGAG